MGACMHVTICMNVCLFICMFACMHALGLWIMDYKLLQIGQPTTEFFFFWGGGVTLQNLSCRKGGCSPSMFHKKLKEFRYIT